MLIVITGDGKGKTTAAIGQAIRALGQGQKVFMAQFIKSESYPSGEDAILKAFRPRVKFLKGGKGFVGILGDKLPFAEHRAAAKKTFAEFTRALRARAYGLYILDELNVALKLKLISLGDIVPVLRGIPEDVNVIVTGRGIHPLIAQMADLVTECKEVKHPFRQKVAARKGLEY